MRVKTPEFLAGLGIERECPTERSDNMQNPVDHDWRRLKRRRCLTVPTLADVPSPMDPGDLKVPDIVRRNIAEF